MKKFIIILFAVFFTGCLAGKQVSHTNIKSKCDYYVDDIERLYTEPFDNITATGIVCDAKNNKSYIPIKNGLAHGKAEIYYDNGTSLEINFEAGKSNETKTFENGILISSFNFIQDDELLISFYRPNGILDYSVYKNGKENTLFREYDTFGNLIKETSYLNGKKNGISKLFYPSGSLKAEVFFTDNKMDGFSKIYYESGALNAEIPYKNDKINGTVKEYYENGILKSEAQYSNHKQHGIQKNYYETGALKDEIPYKNHKQEGVAKSYYENGALETEISFKNGEMEGIMNMYNQDGVLDIQITHKNNMRNGPMKKYNSDGSYWATIIYQNNKAISGKCANGRKWNNAELSNWENGLSVDCGY